MHLFRRAATHYSNTPSLQKNLPGAATCMSILGKIGFRGRGGIEQRAHALDEIKTKVDNLFAAQPRSNGAALDGHGKGAQLFDAELSQLCQFGRQQLFKEALFFARDGGGAPNVLANVAAKRFFQIWNDAVPDAITQRSEILVRSVFAEFHSMRANVFVDLVAPDAEKRTDNHKIDTVNSARRNVAHGAESGGSRAAEQIEQESFDEIIGVMSKEDGATFLSLRDPGKEIIAGVARRGFNRPLLFRGKSADIFGFN